MNECMGLYQEMIKSKWEYCRIFKTFDWRFYIKVMHIKYKQLFVCDMGTNVDSKGFDLENIPNIYQDVEVEESEPMFS
jgi:hypothetical protein